MGWWWRWFGRGFYNDVSVHIAANLHLVALAEHLRVRLPASPPPLGLNVQMDGGGKMLQNCSRLPLIAATTPAKTRPAKHSCTCAYPSLYELEMSTYSGDELSLRHVHCRKTTSLHDHRDVHNRKNSICGTSKTCR